MTGSFDRHTTIVGDDGAFTATLDRSFEIWGPNGGYLSAIALRAADATAAAGHRPASITVQYIGRAQFGAVEVAIETVRTGASALFFVTMTQGGTRFLVAQVWTTARDSGPVGTALAMPDVALPHDLEALEAAVARTGQPLNPFWQHFDVRVFGDPLARNPDDPRVLRWFRYRDFPADADLFLDAGRALLLIDTLVWPAHCRGLDEAPAYLAPSLDVAAWFHAARGGEWLLLDVAADQAGGGLIHGTARVWGLDGRLVAAGASGLAVLPPR